MLLYGEHDGEIADLAKHHKLSNLMNIFLSNTIIIFILGALTYGEKFRFWDYAYSYLGMIKTPNGNGNTISFFIYAAGCIMNSVICFKVSNSLTGQLNKIFFKACGAGYILLVLPCDVINSIHCLGGALVVGSLWFFSIIGINGIYRSGHKLRALLYFLVLNGTVLPYAFMHFVRSPYEQIAQKPALLGLILVMKLIISEMTREDVPDREQIN